MRKNREKIIEGISRINETSNCTDSAGSDTRSSRAPVRFIILVYFLSFAIFFQFRLLFVYMFFIYFSILLYINHLDSQISYLKISKEIMNSTGLTGWHPRLLCVDIYCRHLTIFSNWSRVKRVKNKTKKILSEKITSASLKSHQYPFTTRPYCYYFFATLIVIAE